MIQYMVTSLVLHSEVHTYETTYKYDQIYRIKLHQMMPYQDWNINTYVECIDEINSNEDGASFRDLTCLFDKFWKWQSQWGFLEE